MQLPGYATAIEAAPGEVRSKRAAKRYARMAARKERWWPALPAVWRASAEGDQPEPPPHVDLAPAVCSVPVT